MEQGLTARPFFPWIGGKEKLIPIIVPIFPPGMPCYGEHFGGSGSILLGRPKVRGRTEIYNDYDFDLSNLFVCVRDRLTALLRELRYLPTHSEAEFNAYKKAILHEKVPDFTADEIAVAKAVLTPEQYEEVRAILLSRTELWDVRRAAVYYTVDRRSFNGTRNAFAIRPTNIENFLGLMERASRRLQDVVITNRDFEVSIKTIDSEDTLHYCDPPYFKTEKMYSPEFTVKDHCRLHDTLCNCKGPRVISYNDCDFIRELYDDHYIMHFERQNSMSLKKNSVFEELLITSSRTVRVNIFEAAAKRQQSGGRQSERRHILNLRQIWCEGAFAAQKARHNLRQLFRRGIEAAEDHCLLSATAFNLKRMVRCLG